MTKEPSSDVRERILDAGARLIETHPENFTMDRVASEAGVSRATVYRRFGSAEGLRSALGADRGAEASLARVGIRARVLDSALTEFARAGVHGATIQGIADRAGVSPMTVYNHFDDKEGLVAALISERGPSSLISGAPTGSETFEAMIGAFVSGMVEITQSQRDLFRLVIAPDPITRRAFQRVRSNTGDHGAALESILKTGGLPPETDVRVAATCLMGMILANGVVRPVLFGDDVEDPAALAEQITRLFLKAVS